MRADRQEVVLMLHDFSFRTPDELLAGLTKSSGSQSAMPDSGMGNNKSIQSATDDLDWPGVRVRKKAVSARRRLLVTRPGR